MLLKWIGDSRNVVCVPGWPAADHDEPDSKLAKAKLKSGLYERVKADSEPSSPPLAEADYPREEAS